MKKYFILFLLLFSAVFAQSRPEDLVGRLLLMGFRGDKAPIEQLGLFKPAGFIFYPSNITSTIHTKELISSLQAAADYPLLFALDQEGGPFSAYRVDDATVFPSNMAIAATKNMDFARQKGKLIGQELAYIGFNLDFSPVVDVNINPDNPIIGMRSFGANVSTVAAYSMSLFKGLDESGVAAVAKHFPGHGDTVSDSHIALPIVTGSRERLERVELAPFKAMIAAGVPAIMTAHVIFSEFDKDYPATLSKIVLTDLLRNELGFKGLIITDHMDMNAIAANYGAGEAAILSILAGADLVLIGYREEKQVEVYNALLGAVKSGRIPESRLRDAIAHSSQIARNYPVNNNPPLPNYQLNKNAAQAQALNAVTLLTNDAVLPIKKDSNLLVISPYIKRIKAVPDLAARLANYYSVERLDVSISPSQDEINLAIEVADKADVIVLASYHFRGNFSSELIGLEQKLMQTGKPLVVVALGNPDDIRYFKIKPNAYLATYGFDDSNLTAAARILSGNALPRGKLPMGFPGFKIDYGLENFE